MQHSKLGASSAHRWLNCPGSIKLSDTVPPQGGSKYALEGTAAHKLGENCLNKGTQPEHYLDQMITLDDGSEYQVSEDMVEAVTIYVDYVRERAKLGESFIETKFDLGFIQDGMFGTNDACVYSNLLGVLEVIDYKHGAGIAVSPVENTQLAYYGLGAANIHDLHPDSLIKLTVVQPRAMGESIKSWETTVGYLEKFAAKLKKGAKATQAKNPKLAEGDWCRFCPAMAVCPQLESKALEVAKAEFSDGTIVLPDPAFEMSTVDIEKVLGFSSVMSTWLKSVEAYAFNELERGMPIEGYKLVAKRANRKWVNEEDTKSKLLTEVAVDDMYTTPKLKSPAQLEKLVGKELVATLCEAPDNGNTMVPVSDKRPEVLSTLASEFSSILD